MSQEEQSLYHPEYLTIAEIREMYQHKDKPLNDATIRATLKPLAGTSFYKATAELAAILASKEARVSDLLMSIYGDKADWPSLEDTHLREQAETALNLLSGFSVPLENVFAMQWMEEDELMQYEYRSDILYHDPEHIQVAGKHSAAQLWFYKRGRYLQTISVSSLEYEEKQERYVYPILSEGLLPHRYFSNVNKPPLPFLDPRQSSFVKAFSVLWISPHFSFDAARPQPQQ